MGRRLDPDILNPVEEAAHEYVIALRAVNSALFMFSKKQNGETYHHYQATKAYLKTCWRNLKVLMSQANQRKHI